MSKQQTDLIGEKNTQIMSIGDARIAITVGKDEDTIELGRGLRFLVDDTDVSDPLAYQITKSNRLFNIYNDEGVFRYILNEVQLTDEDHLALRVADYTKWKPSVAMDDDHVDSEYTVAEIVAAARDEVATPPDDDKEVWL